MTEEFEILEKTCETCRIQAESRRIAKAEGVDAAVQFRIPFCVKCDHNPQMALVKTSPFFKLLGKVGIEITDNWQAIPKEADRDE